MVSGYKTVLSVLDIKKYVHHGYYEEERMIGGWYNVSVNIHFEINNNETFEDLNSSVNYEKVIEIVANRIERPCYFIESLAVQILSGLKELSKNKIWEVIVQKLDVPIKNVGSTKITIKG